MDLWPMWFFFSCEFQVCQWLNFVTDFFCPAAFKRWPWSHKRPLPVQIPFSGALIKSKIMSEGEKGEPWGPVLKHLRIVPLRNVRLLPFSSEGPTFADGPSWRPSFSIQNLSWPYSLCHPTSSITTIAAEPDRSLKGPVTILGHLVSLPPLLYDPIVTTATQSSGCILPPNALVAFRWTGQLLTRARRNWLCPKPLSVF